MTDSQTTPPNEISIKRIDPKPLTQEHLDWIEKMGWGKIRIHKMTREQIKETFDVET